MGVPHGGVGDGVHDLVQGRRRAVLPGARPTLPLLDQAPQGGGRRVLLGHLLAGRLGDGERPPVKNHLHTEPGGGWRE